MKHFITFLLIVLTSYILAVSLYFISGVYARLTFPFILVCLVINYLIYYANKEVSK